MDTACEGRSDGLCAEALEEEVLEVEDAEEIASHLVGRRRSEELGNQMDLVRGCEWGWGSDSGVAQSTNNVISFRNCTNIENLYIFVFGCF